MYVCMYNVLCQSSHWLPYTINRIISIIITRDQLWAKSLGLHLRQGARFQ